MEPASHLRKRLSLWTIFYGVMGLTAGFLLFCAVLLGLWSAAQARRAEELVAEIRAEGEPAVAEEIAAHFALAPQVDDVTELWRAGINALRTSGNEIGGSEIAGGEIAGKELPFVGVSDEKSLPKLGQPWPLLEASEAYLQAKRFSLEKFHEAARRGGRGRFPADYSRYAITPSEIIDVRLAARLLRLELEVRVRQGDARGAAEVMRTLLVLHRCLEDDPRAFSYLMRTILDYFATHALADFLCPVPFTEEELREFQAIVRTNRPETSLRSALVGERALVYSALLKPQLLGQLLGKDRPTSLSPLAADRVTYLVTMGDFIAAFDQGFPGCYEAMGDAERAISRKTKHWGGRWTAIYTASLLPQTGAMWEATARDLAALRALEAGIAVELYRREQGKLPDSLAALTPKYLAAPPVDPFFGGEMIYKQTEEGFTIYSVGRNKTDNGGTLEIGKDRDEGIFFRVK